MVATTTGREDNMYIAEESTLAILPVSRLLFHMHGGTTTRRMVVTTTGREDNIAEESTLAILPVCCFFGFFKNLFVVSHMLAMAGGQRRGGWWRRRRDERTTSPKTVSSLHPLSILLGEIRRIHSFVSVGLGVGGGVCMGSWACGVLMTTVSSLFTQSHVAASCSDHNTNLYS